MQRNYIALINIICFIIISGVFFSCRNDRNDYLDENSSDEEIVETVLNRVCTDWNTSIEQVKNRMNGYMLVDSDIDYLKYTDRNGVLLVSYSFQSDSLKASVAIVPRLSNIDLSDYLKGYSYFADISTKNIYYSNSINTVCCSYNYSAEEVDYSILGFAPITSDLY